MSDTISETINICIQQTYNEGNLQVLPYLVGSEDNGDLLMVEKWNIGSASTAKAEKWLKWSLVSAETTWQGKSDLGGPSRGENRTRLNEDHRPCRVGRLILTALGAFKSTWKKFHQENEKTSHRLGEHYCQRYTWIMNCFIFNLSTTFLLW